MWRTELSSTLIYCLVTDTFLHVIYMELCASSKRNTFCLERETKTRTALLQLVTSSAQAHAGRQRRAECFVNRILDSDCCVSGTVVYVRERRHILSKCVWNRTLCSGITEWRIWFMRSYEFDIPVQYFCNERMYLIWNIYCLGKLCVLISRGIEFGFRYRYQWPD